MKQFVFHNSVFKTLLTYNQLSSWAHKPTGEYAHQICKTNIRKRPQELEQMKSNL